MAHYVYMKKMITIVEFPAFLSQVGECISIKERDELIDFLAKNPAAGDELLEQGALEN